MQKKIALEMKDPRNSRMLSAELHRLHRWYDLVIHDFKIMKIAVKLQH